MPFWPRRRDSTVVVESTAPTTSSMNDSMKTGLIVGGVAVGVAALGTLVYFAMKK
ncbi:MAG: hypothetical protein P4L69_07110 [Desulfosporosinus sp.]|nr:hypothetical protein [Desulfosporosinus sp.]